jgi:hypothetical protein
LRRMGCARSARPRTATCPATWPSTGSTSAGLRRRGLFQRRVYDLLDLLVADQPGRPGRGSSVSPASRFSRNRARHFDTMSRETPSDVVVGLHVDPVTFQQPEGAGELSPVSGVMFALVEAGYAVVYQDCRGTWRSGDCSGGDHDRLLHDAVGRKPPAASDAVHDPAPASRTGTCPAQRRGACWSLGNQLTGCSGVP